MTYLSCGTRDFKVVEVSREHLRESHYWGRGKEVTDLWCTIPWKVRVIMRVVCLLRKDLFFRRHRRSPLTSKVYNHLNTPTSEVEMTHLRVRSVTRTGPRVTDTHPRTGVLTSSGHGDLSVKWVVVIIHETVETPYLSLTDHSCLTKGKRGSSWAFRLTVHVCV